MQHFIAQLCPKNNVLNLDHTIQSFKDPQEDDFSPFPKQQTLDSSKQKEFAHGNFKFDNNGRKNEQIENTGKRRNCSLREISPFSTVFKRLVLQTHKNQGLFKKGLNIVGEKKHFLSSPQCFLPYQEQKYMYMTVIICLMMSIWSNPKFSLLLQLKLNLYS